MDLPKVPRHIRRPGLRTISSSARIQQPHQTCPLPEENIKTCFEKVHKEVKNGAVLNSKDVVAVVAH
jgi:hypothetical protein